MATTTAELIRYEDPTAMTERVAVAGFLAGYTGHTRMSNATELRIFAPGATRAGCACSKRGECTWRCSARWMKHQSRTRSTVARRLSTLASFYRYCHDEGLVEQPGGNIDYESRTLGLDRNELGALLVQAGLGPARDHALITLLAMNGLRISETFGANCRRLGHGTGTPRSALSARATSTSPFHWRPAPGRAIDLYIGERASGPIFLGVNGARMDRYAADRTVKRLARGAEINRRISPHSLRHSFITAALDAGVPPRDVHEAASHADPRTTMRFDRPDTASTYTPPTSSPSSSQPPHADNNRSPGDTRRRYRRLPSGRRLVHGRRYRVPLAGDTGRALSVGDGLLVPRVADGRRTRFVLRA